MMTDSDRLVWIKSDNDLMQWWLHSGLVIETFVERHRVGIDAIVFGHLRVVPLVVN